MKRRTFLGATLAALSAAVSAASRPFARRWLRSQRLRRAPPHPTSTSPKWNKATDDIDSKDFVQRVQDYERSLLPADVIFRARARFGRQCAIVR
jgi:hypothetical protein